jgi:hypothetical protein
MSTKRSRDDVIDAIAIAAAKLADDAASVGEEFLTYILRMAEVEARRSIPSAPEPRKRVARSARARGEQSGGDEGAHCSA